MLPVVADSIIANIDSIKLIKVIDERTNQAAIEQIKSAKLLINEFEEAIDWKRKELYEPYKQFLDRKKEVIDKINEFMKQQKKEVGSWELKKMKDMDSDKAKTKTSFATGTTTMKHEYSIKDNLIFICTLLENNEEGWIEAIYDSPNKAMVKAFVEFKKLDNTTNGYPGMVRVLKADVKVR